VSFGSFGIIHAVLFEAVPLYLLEVHRRRLDWPTVRDAAATLDLDHLRLPYRGVEPFHFEVAVNPYSAKPGQRGAVVTAMYKQPYREFARRRAGDVTMVPGVDLLAVSGRLATVLPAAIPAGVNSMLNAMMHMHALPVLGTHREIFDTTELVGKSLSAELGVDLADAGAAIDTFSAIAADVRRTCDVHERSVGQVSAARMNDDSYQHTITERGTVLLANRCRLREREVGQARHDGVGGPVTDAHVAVEQRERHVALEEQGQVGIGLAASRRHRAQL
jgi:hypothetical protein